jgi:hypothetical protein
MATSCRAFLAASRAALSGLAATAWARVFPLELCHVKLLGRERLYSPRAEMIHVTLVRFITEHFTRNFPNPFQEVSRLHHSSHLNQNEIASFNQPPRIHTQQRTADN